MALSQTHIEEHLLAKNYKEGDNESLGILYKYYYATLIMVAYKYTNDSEKSKDIIASVFEKLLLLKLDKRSEITLNQEKGIYPLLYTIVKNKCLDDLKSTRIQTEIKKQIGNIFNLHSANIAYNRFEQDAIVTLLNNLPKRENEILELHLKGYKNEEIANNLNLSYNTVRNTLHSAKQRVRKLWTIFM
jgi:RNA polymerase sigma factor (sigma-70 family)